MSETSTSMLRLSGECRGEILIVEDDFDAREVLQMALEHEGYQVVTAANGLEGLMRMRSEPRPTVVVTDLAMPVMSGYQLIAEKNNDPSLAGIPVIVVSAVASVRGMPPCPADFVLPKPVDLERLLRLIQRFCQQPEPQASSA